MRTASPDTLPAATLAPRPRPRTWVALPALAAALVLAPTGAGAQLSSDEVPFITSPDNVTLEMLRIAGVGPSDHLVDLGSGDGRIVITAARRFGATGLGVEIVPDLVRRSQRAARQAGVADKVSFRVQDLFQTDLAPASVVTMYLLPDVNLRLRPRLLALAPGTRVVSHDWDMGDWQPDRTTVLPVPDKVVGLEKSSKVHLWIVPARVAGLWCGQGSAAGIALQLSQRHQFVEARALQAGRTRTWSGRLHGTALETDGALALAATGERLQVTRSDANAWLGTGAAFTRAGAGGC